MSLKDRLRQAQALMLSKLASNQHILPEAELSMLYGTEAIAQAVEDGVLARITVIRVDTSNKETNRAIKALCTKHYNRSDKPSWIA